MTTFKPARVYVYAEVPSEDGKSMMCMEWTWNPSTRVTLDAPHPDDDYPLGFRPLAAPDTIYELTVTGKARGYVALEMPPRLDTAPGKWPGRRRSVPKRRRKAAP